MHKRQIAALILIPACIFLVVVSTAMLVLSANSNAQKPETTYVLRAWDGRVGLFLNNDTAPTAQYDIYLTLLPPQDAARLKEGIAVESREAAMLLLEDLGN